jgi:hypothetical protein
VKKCVFNTADDWLVYNCKVCERYTTVLTNGPLRVTNADAYASLAGRLGPRRTSRVHRQ